MNYLRFKSDGKLVLTFFEKDYVINSIDDWDAAVEDIHQNPMYDIDPHLICSSSIDFPEDETDDEDLIKLCYAVRGNV